jgi:hypothetical protein
VAQLYPWALGSLSVASYDSQGYGGGILTASTRHSTLSLTSAVVLLIRVTSRYGPRRKHRSSVSVQLFLNGLRRKHYSVDF